MTIYRLKHFSNSKIYKGDGWMHTIAKFALYSNMLKVVYFFESQKDVGGGFSFSHFGFPLFVLLSLEVLFSLYANIKIGKT